MNLLQTVLTNYAFSLGQAGKIAEAVAPLYAARRFGGSPRADEIADVISWTLAEQAVLAIEDHRIGDARALACLGLAAAENAKCLYALAVAIGSANPPTLAHLARRLDDLAGHSEAPIRLRALTFLSEAIFGAERLGTIVDMRDLDDRLVKLLRDLPDLEEASALLQMVRKEASGLSVPSVPVRLMGMADTANQLLGDVHRQAVDHNALEENGELAAAHYAGLLFLAQEQGHDADRRKGALRDLWTAFNADRAATDDMALARMGVITALSPDIEVMAVLMQRLWERADLDSLKEIATLAKSIAPVETAHWINLEYYTQIAALCAGPLDRPAIEASALAFLIEKTDRMIAEKTGGQELRAARTFLLASQHKYNILWDDCQILLEQMKTNSNLENIYSNVISRQCMYMKKGEPVHLDRILHYVMSDYRSLPSEKEFMFYYCSSIGRMDLAYDAAVHLAKEVPCWGALTYLKEFMRVAEQRPAAVIGRSRTGKRVIYGNLVCWGSAFIEKMAWASLPSLMSPKNIPTLVKENDLIIDLITHETNVQELLALREIQMLAEYCEIRIYCFPHFAEFFDWSKSLPYIFFGHAQHFSVLRAQQDNVDVLILSADVVYADGCFDFVARHVSDEPRALFYDGLNCSLTPLRARLAPYRKESVLTIDPQQLAKFAVETMKPIFEHCFYNMSGRSTKVSSPSLFFRKSFGFRIYSALQGVVYVSAAGLQGLTGFDHLTLEGVCSEIILEKLDPDQIIVRTSMDDILWVELDDDDRTSLIPLQADMVSHLDAVKNFFTSYARSLKRFTLFEMAVDHHVDGVAYGEEIDDATELTFLEDLKLMRTTDPIFTELCHE